MFTSQYNALLNTVCDAFQEDLKGRHNRGQIWLLYPAQVHFPCHPT